MKTRYRLTRRGIRGDRFYSVDSATGRRTSLQTTNEAEARQIIHAKNQAERQPVLKLQIAKAYLAGTDNGITTRTWQHAIETLIDTKLDANQHRWRVAAKDKALAELLPKIVIETPAEVLLKAIQCGTVSTNVYLRRLHNFCVDMNWLPWPLIPKRQWPAVKFKEKRAITLAGSESHINLTNSWCPGNPVLGGGSAIAKIQQDDGLTLSDRRVGFSVVLTKEKDKISTDDESGCPASGSSLCLPTKEITINQGEEMAWRIGEHVVRGEIDNRSPGIIKGTLYLEGVNEPIDLKLEGNCYPDLAGRCLTFRNLMPVWPIIWVRQIRRGYKPFVMNLGRYETRSTA